MEAANAGYKGIVKELLKRGCKLKTALSYAKKSGNDDVVALIENEPKRRMKMGGKLLDAIKTKSAKRALGALKLGAPANILGGEEKHSALMFAVLHASLPIIRHLLKFGAKINHQNVYGESPLIWASSHGHLEITRELLKQKADVTLENKYKVNALIEASNAGNADIVMALLKGGARLRDPKNGRTAVHYAAKKGYGKIVDIFQKEPKRLEHREKRIQFGIQLCRALLYRSRQALPISPIHLGIRRFFNRNQKYRDSIGVMIIRMHPALHEDFKFVPRVLDTSLLSPISPLSDHYGRKRRKRRKKRKDEESSGRAHGHGPGGNPKSASASAALAAPASADPTGKKKKKKKKKR